jgi:hypothetical protein
MSLFFCPKRLAIRGIEPVTFAEATLRQILHLKLQKSLGTEDKDKYK